MHMEAGKRACRSRLHGAPELVGELRADREVRQVLADALCEEAEERVTAERRHADGGGDSPPAPGAQERFRYTLILTTREVAAFVPPSTAFVRLDLCS